MDIFTDSIGNISIRAEDGHTTLYAPGSWAGGAWQPTSLSALPEGAAQDRAAELWTPALVAAYRAATEPQPPTPDELVEQFRVAIQSHVDQTARGRLYDNGFALASYVASTNAAWAAEAQAFVGWRDAVWLHAYAELDKVEAGEREVPTIEAFIGELPAIDWPDAG